MSWWWTPVAASKTILKIALFAARPLTLLSRLMDKVISACWLCTKTTVKALVAIARLLDCSIARLFDGSIV
jgi:hypothetical protein